jgi:cysteine desulfurase/selenocysteine lyase
MSTATAVEPIVKSAGLDVETLRAQFPILSQVVHGHPLVYLDNAATTQKPLEVIEALVRYYTDDNSNIHRGVHLLSERATMHYEQARIKVQEFIGAERADEIVFTRGTTESINLVAATYGRTHVRAGDEILITGMEHHSNIVPWQMLCEEKEAHLRVVPVNQDGTLDIDGYHALLSDRTRIVAIVQVSNVLGTINPVREMIKAAHERGIPVLVDGAQSAPHGAVNVQDLGADFFAFSAHKMYGPTGVGALYGRYDLLDAMPPYQGGGDMISSVTFEHSTYNTVPHKFEAGTPNIAGVIGFGAAVDWIQKIGVGKIAQHEHDLLLYGAKLLSTIDGLTVIGNAHDKAAVISFVMDGVHPHDIGTVLDLEGIAIRTGQHCAQPVMDRYGIPATARASFACYNTKAELDKLAEALVRVKEVFE